MAEDYKCKYCGEEFENKGFLTQHYTQSKGGNCVDWGKDEQEGSPEVPEKQEEAVQAAVVEGMSAERDPLSIPKPHYNKDAEPIDMTDITNQQGVEAQVSALAKETAEKLKQCPQEKVMIPKDKLNPSDSFVVVGINGWNLQIQREVPVTLPVTAVVLLEQGGYGPTRVR